jgi:predicted nucleotidyltransferase
MSTIQTIEKLKTLETWDKQHPSLKLLILFGSRARDEHTPSSDWDIAFLNDSPSTQEIPPTWFPGADLIQTLSQQGQIPSKLIDIVNLSTCSDLLAHFVARDGQLLYEREAGEFQRFQNRTLKAPAELQNFRQAQREKVLQALERWGA